VCEQDGNDAPLSFPSPEQPTKSISLAEQFKKKFKFKAPSTTVIGTAATAATMSSSFGAPSTTFGAAAAAATMSGLTASFSFGAPPTTDTGAGMVTGAFDVLFLWSTVYKWYWSRDGYWVTMLTSKLLEVRK